MLMIRIPRTHTIAIVLSGAATSLIDNTKLPIRKDFVPMKSPYEVTTGLAAAFDVEVLLQQLILAFRHLDTAILCA